MEETKDLMDTIGHLTDTCEKLKNHTGDLKTTIEKNEEVSRASLAKNEMALLTLRNDSSTQQQRLKDLTEELESSQTFSKRQRKEYEEEIVRMHGRVEQERTKETERRTNQAKEARGEYKVLSEKNKTLQNEVTVANRTWRQRVSELEGQLADNTADHRRERERLEDDLADVRSQLDDKHNETAQLRAQSITSEEERSEASQRAFKLKQDLDNCANERDSYASIGEVLQANLSNMEEALTQMTDECTEKQAQLRTATDQARGLQQNNDHLLKTSEHERKQFEQTLNEERGNFLVGEAKFKTDYQAKIKELADAHVQLETVEHQLRRQVDNQQRLDKEYADISMQLQTTQTETQSEVAHLKDALARERNDSTRLRGELSDLRSEVATQNINLGAERSGVVKLKSDLDRTQQLLSQSEQRHKLLADQFNIHDNTELADIQAEINRIRTILTDTQAALTESASELKFASSAEASERTLRITDTVQKYLQDAFGHTTKMSSQIVQANDSHQTLVKANGLKIEQLEAALEDAKRALKAASDESSPMQDRLRTLEIELAHMGEKLVMKDLQLQSLTSSEDAFKEHESSLTEALDLTEKSVQLLKEKTSDLETRLDDAIGKSDQADRELAAALIDKTRVEEVSDGLEAELQMAKEDCLALKDALRDAELDSMAKTDEIGTLKTNLMSFQQDIDTLQQNLQEAALTAQQAITGAQKQMQSADRASSDAQRSQATLADAEKEITRQFGEIERLERANRTTQVALEEALAVRYQLDNAAKADEQQFESLKVQLAEAEARAEHASNSLHDALQSHHDLETKHSELMVDNDNLLVLYEQTKDEAAQGGSQSEELRSENSRLQMLLEEAGRNIREHVETETMSIREIERLRSAVEHAEVTSRRAREWVERTTQQHEAARAKIIDRADREIKRQRALLDEVKAEMSTLNMPLDLNIVRDSASRVFALLCQVAKASGCNLNKFEGLPDVQVQQRGTEIRVVLLWLNAIEGVSKVLQDTLVLATHAEQRLNGDAADDTVSRLLSAVKRFHSAKEAGDAIVQGRPHPDSNLAKPAAMMPPSMQAPPIHQRTAQQQQQQQQQQQPPPPQQAPPAPTESVSLLLDAQDEDLDAVVKFKPFSLLAEQEQQELYKDWKRLKVKVQDINVRLRSAKAAVAVGRFREETQRVYTRNRDRLVARILLKPAKKSRTLRLLQILSDTAV